MFRRLTQDQAFIETQPAAEVGEGPVRLLQLVAVVTVAAGVCCGQRRPGSALNVEIPFPGVARLAAL